MITLSLSSSSFHFPPYTFSSLLFRLTSLFFWTVIWYFYFNENMHLKQDNNFCYFRTIIRKFRRKFKIFSFCSKSYSRACLENAFCKMCVTVCEKFFSDEGVVAGYDNRIRDKFSAKWGVQIAGMIFQPRSSVFGKCFRYCPMVFPVLFLKTLRR